MKEKKILNKLIYISGSPRGGSTIFFDLFSKHDSLYKIPGMTHFYSNIVRHNKCLSTRLLRLVYKIPLWHDVELISNNDKVFNYIESSLKKKNLKNLYQGYVLSSSLYKGDYNNISKYKYWVDKANDWRGLFWVEKNFPSAIFIFTIMDPRSICYSIVGRQSPNKKDNLLKNKEMKSYISTAITLNHMYSRFIFFGLINNRKSYFVCYEDLINNGKKLLNKLYINILGESVGEDKVSDFIKTARGASSHSKESGRYQIENGLNKSALCRWSDLDEDLIVIIEILNKSAMKYFSYRNSRAHTLPDYVRIYTNIGIKSFITLIVSKFYFSLSKILSIFKTINIYR